MAEEDVADQKYYDLMAEIGFKFKEIMTSDKQGNCTIISAPDDSLEQLYYTVREDARKEIFTRLFTFLKESKAICLKDPVVRIDHHHVSSQFDVTIDWIERSRSYTQMFIISKKGNLDKNKSRFLPELEKIFFERFKENLDENLISAIEKDVTALNVFSKALPSRKTKWNSSFWSQAKEVFLEKSAVYDDIFNSYTRAQQKVIVRKMITRLRLSEAEIKDIVIQAKAEMVQKS